MFNNNQKAPGNNSLASKFSGLGSSQRAAVPLGNEVFGGKKSNASIEGVDQLEEETKQSVTSKFNFGTYLQ